MTRRAERLDEVISLAEDVLVLKVRALCVGGGECDRRGVGGVGWMDG